LAACAAGVFNVEDGIRLATARIENNLTAFERTVSRIDFRPPELPSAGERIDTADYWLREFSPGPDHTLQLGEAAPAVRIELPATACETQAALAGLYVRGCPINWRRVHEGTGYRRVRLPGHPFTRQYYWFAPPEEPECRIYQTVWKEAALCAAQDGIGRWVVLAGNSNLGDRLAGLLRQAGRDCEVVPDAYAATAAVRGGAASIVFLSAMTERGASPDREAGRDCDALLELLHTLIREAPGTRIQIVTRGAVPVLTGEGGDLALGQSTLWGLARVLQREEPQCFGGIVDLDPHAGPVEADLLAAHLLSASSEDVTAFRDGRRYVPRLTARPEEPTDAFEPQPDGVYLITGGLGSLGMRVARWLAERGARHIVLTGRSAGADDAERARLALQAAGANALIFPGDVSREADMTRILEAIGRDLPPLRGIVHAAGVVDDGILRHQNSERMARVFAPKVRGAWNLHRLTEGMPLDFFVLFSAGAGLLGSPGQGTYAAANAFLDALAHYRRARGLPGLSINWGPWSGGGMATATGDLYRRRLEEHGVRSLSPGIALAAMNRLLQSGAAQAAVLDIDWNLYSRHLPEQRDRTFLADLQPETMPAPAPSAASFARRLADKSWWERQEMLAEKIEAELAVILRIPASQFVDRQRGFTDMGVDSLLALELKDRLEGCVGRPLPSTVVFEHPSVEALAQHLAETLFPLDSVLEPSASVAKDVHAGRIDAMSIAEVEAQLSGKLATLLGEVSQ
jgi:NADP-dependent 3-hydroxy acid dehydrogenase YdfG